MSGLQISPGGLTIGNFSINASDYGAKGDGVTDDSAALNAAFAAASVKKGTVILLPGTYLVGATINIPNGVSLQGVGQPTLKVKDGSTADPALLSSNATSDSIISGVKLDGNRSNASGFSNVCLIYNATRVVYENCYFTNCRGIALYMNGAVNSGSRYCKFYDNGTLNRVTSQSSDRKQSFACTSCTAPFALFNDIQTGGLDLISFTGSSDISIIGNRCVDNDSGSIYLSTNNGGVVSDNRVNNCAGVVAAAGGNGIDIHDCNDLVVTGNYCYKNGAAGILVAGNSNRVSITGNVCKSNKQVASVNNHRGGITFELSSGTTMSDIVVSGCLCDDDQGASTTQLYAIDCLNSGGSFSNIRIAKDNMLVGRNASGVVTSTNIYRTFDLGAQPYPAVINLADQATANLCSRTLEGRIFIRLQNTNAVFDGILRNAQAPASLITTTFTTTDSGTTAAIFDDAATNIVLKNRRGSTSAFTVSLDYAI